MKVPPCVTVFLLIVCSRILICVENVKVIINRFCCLQLKSSLLLHLDGTSAIAEDIGRQVRHNINSPRYGLLNAISNHSILDAVYCHPFIL